MQLLLEKRPVVTLVPVAPRCLGLALRDNNLIIFSLPEVESLALKKSVDKLLNFFVGKSILFMTYFVLVVARKLPTQCLLVVLGLCC